MFEITGFKFKDKLKHTQKSKSQFPNKFNIHSQPFVHMSTNIKNNTNQNDSNIPCYKACTWTNTKQWFSLRYSDDFLTTVKE